MEEAIVLLDCSILSAHNSKIISSLRNIPSVQASSPRFTDYISFKNYTAVMPVQVSSFFGAQAKFKNTQEKEGVPVSTLF